MGERYSFYLSDDEEELQEFIEEAGDDVFDSQSALIKKALKHFREDKGEAIEELMTDEDNRDVLI